MTDTNQLIERLDQSGLTRTFIAGSLGATENKLEKKINNELEFKASEIYAIKKLLNLTSREIDEIFFKQRKKGLKL
jgi:hypothetical protein